MPIYVYEIITKDGSVGEHFQVMQKMTDPPLQAHPETGEPVRRVISAPNLPGKYTDAATKSMLSDKNLDRLGFTKYQRSGDNTWDKTAGKGPDSISRD